MLHVHHADHADVLVSALADVVARPPADPFAREVIAVHSRGIERWLAQQLSLRLGTTPGRQDGVAANIDFPFPASLVGRAVAATSGVDPVDDPWRPDRAVWPLLGVVTAAAEAGDLGLLGPLAAHVIEPGGTHPHRRLAAVRRVADLFDRYAVHRPGLLRAWASGQDVDATGQPLTERSRWQAGLWRALRAIIDVPSMPERLAIATAALAAGRTASGQTLDLDLPDRLALFGLTALPLTYLEVLAALAAGPTRTSPTGRDVHLFLLHPSPAVWQRVDALLRTNATAGRQDAALSALPPRDEDPTRTLPKHPLLRTWGRDAREMQLTIRSLVPADATDELPRAPTPAASPRALLQHLQDGVRHDLPLWQPGTVDERALLAPDDHSVIVHRCHGPARQTEVLRDVLLDLLVTHPDLEPRDIVVLCPDIERFAPLVRAVFGSHAVRDAIDADLGSAAPADQTPAAGGQGDLRVQLADRSLRQTNPLLQVVADLLHLADGRVTASQVLDLLTRAPVRRRFRFDEDALTTIETWLQTTGIRWGFDGEHRRAAGVPTAANTWRSGLDRLLVGVAAADEQLRTVAGVVPEDAVEGADVDLAGKLAELIDRLQHAVHSLAGPQDLTAWCDAIASAVDELCGPQPLDRRELGSPEAWQRIQLTRILDDLVATAGGHAKDGGAPRLSLPEIRALLAGRLRGGPSRAAHRTGQLTVCTLVPMRSVPHRVVVLLGMDDEVFPRRTVPDGDDLLAARPLVGDRDPRTEDRQLLLDALLAAGDHLVVLTTGRDPRTNDPKPPAVPIGELLDAIDRTVRSGIVDPDGREVPASACITVDHPLQPFAPARFRRGGLGHPDRPLNPDAPFGFDHNDLEAALALTGPRGPAPRLVPDTAVLPPPPSSPGAYPAVVEVRDLVAFVVHPCKAFLRERLELTFPRHGEVPDDALPTELRAGLSRWAVGDRLLTAVLRGSSLDRALEVEHGRGVLPPGRLAAEAVTEIRATVESLLASARLLGVDVTHPGRTVAIDVTLPSGRRLRGAVDDVVGHVRRHISYSKLKPKYRLTAWIELLALTATQPETPWVAATLGRGRDYTSGKPHISLSHLGPHDGVTHRSGSNSQALDPGCLGRPGGDPAARQQRAFGLLDDLCDLRERGLASPLPLACETAATYAHAVWDRDIGILGARKLLTYANRAWTTGDGWPKEDRDEAIVRVLGDLTLDELRALPPTSDEDGDGWFAEVEPGRFGRLARRIWFPLLCCEQLEDRR